MSESLTAARHIEAKLAGEAATARLARRLAGLSRPGDVIALWGDLGAGKTSFARAFILALAGRPEEVPSPTFTLVQIYPAPVAPVWHFDLYRVTDPGELDELGLDEALAGGIVLIEWPDRLGSRLPADRLDVRLDFAVGGGADDRQARLTGHGDWARRLAALGV